MAIIETQEARLLRPLLVASILAAGLPAFAQNVSLPQFYTNQGYVEEAIGRSPLDINNATAVFAYVLGNLPDRVKVYPTENYYYFSFIHNHNRYAGNIRLDVLDRDKGEVHFAYYKDLAEWKNEDPIVHVVLDRRRGVEVEKLGPLAYRITQDKKSVVFELNDLSGVKPPAGALGPDEVYLGPIFDESAIRFFLVFNRKLKIFHYILDETVEVADELVPLEETDRILIGNRTGFAYYRDQRIDRKILIGIFEGNARVNNYFDGPFDQLPDNFIEGESLREAILAVEPSLAGTIDRFGISPGGDDRYLIAPYRHYRTDDDLMVFDDCANDKRIPAANYYECFVFEDDESVDEGQPKAVAAKKKASARISRTRPKHP